MNIYNLLELDNGERVTIHHAICVALNAKKKAFTKGDLAILQDVLRKLERAGL